MWPSAIVYDPHSFSSHALSQVFKRSVFSSHVSTFKTNWKNGHMCIYGFPNIYTFGKLIFRVYFVELIFWSGLFQHPKQFLSVVFLLRFLLYLNCPRRTRTGLKIEKSRLRIKSSAPIRSSNLSALHRQSLWDCQTRLWHHGFGAVMKTVK